MKYTILLLTLFSLHFLASAQPTFLLGVTAGYGMANWKEHPKQSGTSSYDLSIFDNSTSGTYSIIGISAQLLVGKLAIGPSYRHYDMSFSSPPSILFLGSEYKFNSLGAKANYIIKLSEKFQLSPGLDAGIFFLSGAKNNVAEQKLAVSPSVELRRALGKVIVTCGIDGNFLFFKYAEYSSPPSYVLKDKASISSFNFKVGILFKLNGAKGKS